MHCCPTISAQLIKVALFDKMQNVDKDYCWLRSIVQDKHGGANFTWAIHNYDEVELDSEGMTMCDSLDVCLDRFVLHPSIKGANGRKTPLRLCSHTPSISITSSRRAILGL